MLWKPIMSLFHLKMTMAIAELNITQLPINNHYLIGGTAYLIVYSLEHHDEVIDIAGCHLINQKTAKYYYKDKSGKRFIKALQVFKLLN